MLTYTISFQVPVFEPHPCSRAQCSNLRVPVTLVGVVDLSFVGLRLKGKAEVCRRYWEFGLGAVQTFTCSQPVGGQVKMSIQDIRDK